MFSFTYVTCDVFLNIFKERCVLTVPIIVHSCNVVNVFQYSTFDLWSPNLAKGHQEVLGWHFEIIFYLFAMTWTFSKYVNAIKSIRHPFKVQELKAVRNFHKDLAATYQDWFISAWLTFFSWTLYLPNCITEQKVLRLHFSDSRKSS